MSFHFSRKKLLYTIYLVVAIPLLMELALRIYNPFNFRIKGNKILLQANRRFVIYNKSIPVIDSIIIHRKNGLGMRGPDKPEPFEKYLSVITVGGSTTECGYINEGKTWSDLLLKRIRNDFPGAWLNNAGLAGHSTFGHTVLLEDYLLKLKPKVILFLVGCNDMLLDSLRPSDKSNMKGYYATFYTFLTKNSELCSVLVNLWRTRTMRSNHLDDTYYDLEIHKKDHFFIPETTIRERLDQTRKYLPAYAARLQNIIDICLRNNIRPVLITQPSLYGKGIDEATGADLETVKHDEKTNGRLWWEQLQLYNQTTASVAAKNNILLIDLASRLDKGSRYFYDYVHFTNRGNDKVSEIVYESLLPYLREQFLPGKRIIH